jgi:hypothetical protein
MSANGADFLDLTSRHAVSLALRTPSRPSGIVPLRASMPILERVPLRYFVVAEWAGYLGHGSNGFANIIGGLLC